MGSEMCIRDSSEIWQILLGLMIVGTVIAAWRRDHPVFDVAAAVAVGVSTAWTWIPCVGPHLGDVLNSSRADPWGQLGGTIAFMVGLSVPVITLMAIGLSLPTLAEQAKDKRVMAFGMVLLLVIGAAFVTTTIDDLSSELARRSSFS